MPKKYATSIVILSYQPDAWDRPEPYNYKQRVSYEAVTSQFDYNQQVTIKLASLRNLILICGTKRI